MKKIGIILIGVFLFLAVISSCGSEDTNNIEETNSTNEVSEINVEALNVDETSVVLFCGEKEEIGFSVSGNDDFSYEDVVFISEDEGIATAEYSSEDIFGAYFTLEGVSEGKTVVYIQTNDGSIKSEKIEVTVLEKASETTEKEKEETEYNTDEATVFYTETEEDTQEYTDEYDYTQEEEEYAGPAVYITPTGKKYHYSASCAGKNAIERNLYDVEGAYDPCKKCAQ